MSLHLLNDILSCSFPLPAAESSAKVFASPEELLCALISLMCTACKTITLYVISLSLSLSLSSLIVSFSMCRSPSVGGRGHAMG